MGELSLILCLVIYSAIVSAAIWKFTKRFYIGLVIFGFLLIGPAGWIYETITKASCSTNASYFERLEPCHSPWRLFTKEQQARR